MMYAAYGSNLSKAQMAFRCPKSKPVCIGKIKDYKLSKDSLRTPNDKDEAVIMFITKNRLK